MRILRSSAFAAILILALLGSSCSLFRRSKAKTPPAPLPAPAAPASKPAPQPPKPSEIPAPPDIQPQPPAVQPPPTGPQELPRPPRRRSRVPTPAPAPAPAPETVPATQPPAPPQLEQILTPQQQKTYNEEIDRNISRAKSTLTALGGRRLNGEQQTYLERIRAFLKQAEEARSTDLFRAKNLAERASLLADDLLRSTQ